MDVTFHRFPSNIEMRSKWVAAIKRQNFVPCSSSRICSDHFKKTDFTASKTRRRLKEKAVPSVFEFPPHLQPKTVTPRRKLIRHSPKKRLNVSNKNLNQNVSLDHSYGCAPKKAVCLKQRLTNLRKKLKNTRAKLKNRSSQNRRLKDIIADLRNKHLIESEAEAMLQESFSGMSLDLFQHIKNASKGKKPYYLPKVRNFALSLHFLSPKAYDFIRPVLRLPHPRCLRRWKSSVNCSPGYLNNMLKVASVKAKDTNSNLCSLIVDEMSLRRDVSWVPSQNRYCGFTDFGQGPVGNTVATNALLFMLVSLKGRWKAPIAYFLTDHISSGQLAMCVKEAIMRAADHDVIVKTFVADGLKANMRAAVELGCNLDCQNNMRTYFQHPHPNHANEKIYFICDPPHMLKLFRNFLAERGIIKRHTDQGVQTIAWHYIKSLHQLQRTDSLYLANKLSDKHINFTNVKMKVSIAAQTLSLSVATAIDHLREDLKLPEFQDSEETCQFLRQIDRLFDTLNSKNPFAKGSKAALSQRNVDIWRPFLQDVQTYLLSLLEPSGLPIYQGKRNQCVVGFIISAQSTLDLAMELLSRQDYRYLLTYKYSQDHVEMFFSKIRQRNGWNNNPTSEQFRSALKSLMLSSTISPSRYANAVPQDDTVELVLTPNHDLERMAELVPIDSEFMAADIHLDSPLMTDTDWRKSCLFYTAGFVAKRVDKMVKCTRCSRALFENSCLSFHGNFLLRKNKGGLAIPSKGVVEVLEASEKAFRTIMPSPATMDILPSERYIDLHMQAMVLSHLQARHQSLFPSLADHFYDHEIGIEADHVSRLVKTIASIYLKMRLLKAGKLFHQRKILMGQTSKRMKWNKIILFSGQ